MIESAPKCALIVDDSQTARQMLGKVLERHQIRTEMAGSAEEALNYLVTARPDVIFMDHLMPGMDGFQAVRAIKNNPATATIPIMMYTSQAGELYVGQARALGAVGVLPKQIKPVQVADTLKSLNLIPLPETESDSLKTEEETEVIPEADVSQTLADVERMMEPADWGELHTWFEQMLHHHQDALRSDIESSVARLLKESAVEQGTLSAGPQVGIFGKELSVLRGLNATTLLVAGLSLFAATFFWLYLNTQEAWRVIYDQNVQLLNTIEAEREAARANSGTDSAGEIGQTGSDLRAIVRDLEWQANGDASYGPDDIPYGDQRLEVIDRLIDELRTVGFTGVVQLDSHVGDFCFVQASDGSWSPGEASQSISNCGKFGLGAENALAQSAKQSVAFANYIAALDGDGLEDIRIIVNPLGNARPILTYPERSSDSTVGEWNRIAQQNNHVQIRLIADEWIDRQPADLF
jgi:CheY-like chemotaxis protein